MRKGLVVTALLSLAILVLSPNEAMGLVVAVVGGLVVNEIERVIRKADAR